MNTLAAYMTALGPPECIEVGQLPVLALGPTDVLLSGQALVNLGLSRGISRAND